MSKKGPGYISAVRSIIEGHKVNVFLCGAPLVALVAQIQWIKALDSFAIKALITASVFCFVAGGAMAVFFLDLARHYLAKTELDSDLNGESETPFIKHVLEIHHRMGDMTEEKFVRIARIVSYPTAYAIGFGWLFVVLALVVAIWT